MGFVKDERDSKGVGQGSKYQARRGDHMSEVTKILCECTGFGAAAPTLPKKVLMHARSCKFKVSSAKFPSQCKAAETGTSLRTVALIMALFLLCF